MTSYAPTPMYQIAEGYANATAKNMQNQQSLYDMHAQREADSALPQILMGLAGGSGNMPNTPSPGQPSVPAPDTSMGSPGGGPNISAIPPQQPQSAQAPAAQQGGYDLPTLIGTIKQQYPNIQGAALRNILATVNPYLLTPATRIALQRLGISQENADTSRYRAGVAGENSQIRQMQNFGQPIVSGPGAPPAGPMQGGLAPGAQPPIGGQPNASMPGDASLPGVSQQDMAAINALAGAGGAGGVLNKATNTPSGPPGGGPSQPPQAPNAQMSGGFGGVAPTAPVKGQNAEAADNAKLRTQYVASMQNDMQLADNLNQLKTLLASPKFGTGAAGDTRAQAAGAMYYLTGDPKWNDAATVAQLDQKAMAGVLVDQVSSLAASGSGNRSMATDLMKKYVAQMKPEMSKTPDANKSVVEGATATLERNSLMKQFFNDVTQKYGIYPQQASHAVLHADRMYPLVTVNPNGSLQVNKDNINKFKQALTQVSGTDYNAFALANGQDNPDRELTSQEMEEYNRLLAAQKGAK